MKYFSVNRTRFRQNVALLRERKTLFLICVTAEANLTLQPCASNNEFACDCSKIALLCNNSHTCAEFHPLQEAQAICSPESVKPLTPELFF